MSALEQAFRSMLHRHAVDAGMIDGHWLEVVRAHTAKGRHYHTLAHLEDVHARLGEVAHEAEGPDALLLATAYHDIIYDVVRQDNEVRSAARMSERMRAVGIPEALVRRAEGHILATKAHGASSDPDTDLFTDADLSILGAEPARYQAYTQGIRREYRRYPDLLYMPGRRKVVRHFLAMSRIFKTASFHARYEAAARVDLEEELRLLGGEVR